MLLEVCGKYGFNDKKAKTFELNMIQVDQKIEFCLGKVQTPGRCSVVVLQHRSVIVQHGLHNTGGKHQVVREGEDDTLRLIQFYLYSCQKLSHDT